jgi:hypothetical protein
MFEHPPHRSRAIEVCRTLWYMNGARFCIDTVEIQIEGFMLLFFIITILYEWWLLICKKYIMKAAASTCKTERQPAKFAMKYQFLQLATTLERCHLYV